jgi:hypothetical protein
MLGETNTFHLPGSLCGGSRWVYRIGNEGLISWLLKFKDTDSVLLCSHQICWQWMFIPKKMWHHRVLTHLQWGKYVFEPISDRTRRKKMRRTAIPNAFPVWGSNLRASPICFELPKMTTQGFPDVHKWIFKWIQVNSCRLFKGPNIFFDGQDASPKFAGQA